MPQNQIANIKDADIKPGTKVFVRIDCNVPFDEHGSISDDFRLKAVVPTLEYLRDCGAVTVIAGAIGRPKGKRDEALITKPIASYFENSVFEKCEYVSEALDESVQNAIATCRSGNAVMLENLRFYAEEESNDRDFAKKLASLCDVYVNDAFGQSHRNQASIVAITDFLPSFSGVCLDQEIAALQSILQSDVKGNVAIVGGAKVSDKLGVIEILLNKCEQVIIGGAMAYTFLKGQGFAIGNSLCEDSFVDRTIEWCKTGKVILPTDSVVANSIDSQDTKVQTEIDEGQAGFDIGPESARIFTEVIAKASRVLWNGPMGVFEKPQFSLGTKAVATAIADSNAYSVIGGGDSVAAVRQLDLEAKFDHVSTGGGATLEFIENGSLVGIDALNKKAKI